MNEFTCVVYTVWCYLVVFLILTINSLHPIILNTLANSLVNILHIDYSDYYLISLLCVVL